MDAGLQQLPRDVVVQAGGRGDHGGIELIEQAGAVGAGLGVALRGNPLAAGRQRDRRRPSA